MTEPQQDTEVRARGRHEAPEGAQRHPLIDLRRDPTPGVADHAAPADEDDDA